MEYKRRRNIERATAFKVLIEQAAKEMREMFENKYNPGYNFQHQDIANWIEETYIAGAEARQPEIDALTTDCERYKQDIADGQAREEIARGIIQEKRDKIDELRRHKLNLQKRLNEQYELLVKHGIKEPAIRIDHQHNA